MPIKQVPRARDKKKDLLARKEEILSNIKYYEQRIKEDSAAVESTQNFVDSSDSDEEPQFHIDNGQSLSALKAEEERFKTRLQATNELACLKLLNYEINAMVDEPILKCESAVIKPGLWREVKAQCCVDLVPYSISFYVHQTDGPFPVKSYRGLEIVLEKNAQGVEVCESVLNQVTSPSIAVELLRSYSVTYRSRRTSLARLADKYGETLHMELLAEGGYSLKLAGLMTMSWRLENFHSPLGAFHHKFSFNLEYIAESHLKIIKAAYSQLSNPSLETDDRTLLLAKIISTCLEAKNEQKSLLSVTERHSKNNLEKRDMALETEPTVAKKTKEGYGISEVDDNTKDNTNDKSIDSQIMAPPKSLPIKGKPKGKENKGQNKKAVKRSADADNVCDMKKAKINKNDEVNIRQNDNEKVKTVNNKEKSNDGNIIELGKDNGADSQAVKKGEAKNQTDKEYNCKNLGDKKKLAKNKIDKENVGKKQSDKEKLGKNQTDKKNVTDNKKNKEGKSAKSTEIVKDLRNKNMEDKTVTKRGNVQKLNGKNIQKQGNVNDIQEKSKNKTNNNMESQKVDDEDKLVNSDTKKQGNVNVIQEKSKNKTNNNTESQKIAADDKLVNSDTKKLSGRTKAVSSKSEQLAKNTETQKEPNNDKVASTKNQVKTSNVDKNDERVVSAVYNPPAAKKTSAISLAADVAAKKIAVKNLNENKAGVNVDKKLLKNNVKDRGEPTQKTNTKNEEKSDNSSKNDDINKINKLPKCNKNLVNKLQNFKPTNSRNKLSEADQKNKFKGKQLKIQDVRKVNRFSAIIATSTPKTNSASQDSNIGQSVVKSSKIPQLIPSRLSAIKKMKRNAQRHSPRKFAFFKTSSDSSVRTNIPKMLRNPYK